jgi:hypothetical protein
MADWVEAFAVTIPPNTPQGAFTAPLRFSRRGRIERVTIVVPDGPVGRVGFRLRFGGTVVVPLTPGAFIIANNAVFEWSFWGRYDSGDWSCEAYNLGGVEHTLYFYFLVNEVVPERPAGPLLATTTAREVGSLTG